MLNRLIKAAAIGVGVYVVGRCGEIVGYCKGLVAGVRTAANNPEWAVASATRWDDLDKQWEDLKNKKA